MKNKTPFLTFSVFISLLFFSNLYAAQTYRLQTPEYSIKTGDDGFHKIVMKGFYSASVSGFPGLPARLYRAVVPPEIKLKSIKVSCVREGITNLGEFNIKQVPHDVTRADGRKIMGGKTDVYSTNSFFPGHCIEYVGFSQMRKWRIVSFRYSPFQYNPVTKELQVVSALQVTIDYKKGERTRAIEFELGDSLMDKRTAKYVINHKESLNWYKPTKDSDTPRTATYDYVIITTNAIESASIQLSDFMSNLVGRGFSPLVITEDEFGGLTGQAPDGTAEKIRQWLQANYIAYGIKYALLIGNPDPDDPANGSDSVGDIPMKMCWPRYGSGSYEQSPTDSFYADLTGNWDLDGDLYYGEWEDFTGAGGVDFSNEIFVGRIPVYSGTADLDSILAKTINYAYSTDTAWRLNALLPISFSDAGYDGAPLAEQMMDDYLHAAGYSTWTLYQQGNGACGPDSIYPSDEELRGGTVVRDRWSANDYGLVVWWGHGSTARAIVGYNGCDDGYLMDYTYAPALDDAHPSFVYQNSCYNGLPENSLNLQYALLKNGGIGTVSATRVSWYNTGVGYGSFDGSTTNSGIGYEFASRIAAEQPAGEALYNAKASMVPDMNTRLMNFYDFNLYGDPAISTAKIDPSLTLMSPNGGQVLKLGTTRNITWDYGGLTDNIHIVLKQNGTNVALIAKNISPAPRSYSWTVGDCLLGAVTAGDNFKVLIREKGTTLRDLSDDFFSIKPSLTVTSPNGGEVWTMGTLQTISWTGSGLTGNLYIALQQNGINTALLAKNIAPGSGSYPWTVGNCLKGTVAPGTTCKIMILDRSSSTKDRSNADFSID
ncbi:MAG: hypothetical protein KAT34_03755 [Candidatus Aminicenantes bacterium]|nr:hypothetical protein [Candidatus Aminicenantes bacterium]